MSGQLRCLALTATFLRSPSRWQGFGEVVGRPFRDHVSPRRVRGRRASRALRRRPAAMFVVPARRRAPMARLRQVAMARGALPVRSWEASSAKVVSRTWCRASICPVSRIRAASWAGVGLLGGQAGDRVDGLDGGLPVLRSVRRRLIWTAWRAPGKRRLFTVADLDPADLAAAVAGAPGAALQRDLLPGKALELLSELLLVPFDDHDVVRRRPSR